MLPPTGEHRIFEDDDPAGGRPSRGDASLRGDAPPGDDAPPGGEEPDGEAGEEVDLAEQTPWLMPHRATLADTGESDPDEFAEEDEPAAGGSPAGADEDAQAQDLAFVEEIDAHSADVLPTGAEHSAQEISERRVAAHRRHRRNGRIRLLVAVTVLAVAGAFVYKTVHKTGHKAKAPAIAGSPVAAAGSGPGHLAAGSATALPGNLLIADRGNHRLVVVSPKGQIVWQYPKPGESIPRQLYPDYAYFTPSGSSIMITEEGISVIDAFQIQPPEMVYRYGRVDVPGSKPNLLHDPSAALRLGTGEIIAADIRNCRVIVVTPPNHHVTHQLGAIGNCKHDPPTTFASPTTAFPTSAGGVVVNELTGYVDLLSHTGKLIKSLRPPGFKHPSMTAEVKPGELISVEHSHPGAVETYTTAGKRLWRYAVKKGEGELDDPSLATVLPSGDVLVSDDYNDRVVVIDPHTNAIVWQYGHRHVAGSRAGFLSLPVGIDLVRPYSLLDAFATAKPPA